MDDDELIGSFEDLLAKERVALLSGALDEVVRLSVQKESLLDRLGGIHLDPDVADRVRQAASGNADLMAAAIRGVGSAIERLKAMARGPGPLTTYDRTGKMRRLAEPSTSVTRRA